jgi:CBS domain-containing protein
VPASLTAATIAQLQRHAPFDRMAPEHLEYLAARLKLKYFAADTAILDPTMGAPNRIYVIKQGAVIVGSAQRGGPELALQEGECFPLGAMVAGRPVSGTYRAPHDTFCFELDAEGFNALVQMSSTFHDFCTRRIAHLLEHALVNLQSDIALNTGQRLPLERTLDQIVLREPVTCPGTTTVRAALEIMQREGIGSMLVTDAKGALAGIFTLKDLLSRVALGSASLEGPIAAVMTPDPVSMPPNAFAYEAALTMSERGIHHLVVMDGPRIAGLLSEKDLFALQRTGLRRIGVRIGEADTIEALAQIAGDAREMTRDLLVQGVEGAHLVRILASLNDRLSRRVIQLELAAGNIGIENICWIAMGSEGRDERTLASDQDNGIIFSDGGDAEAMRERLRPVAERINLALAEVGFALCRGNIMAGNPRWCLSESEWRARFASWIAEGDPAAVLGAVIFFDFRPLFGASALARRLREWLAQEVAGNARFLRSLAENALANRPPLGIVRDFATGIDKAHPEAIDLKINGTTLFVDGARVLALAHGVEATNTAERLRAAAERGRIMASDAEGWVTAMNFIQTARLRHQHAQLARGEPADNFVNPDRLTPLERRLLKEALRSARGLQQRLQIDYKLSL